MAKRNLFLYSALACFLGIVAIFVFDGYMGVYDTLYITTGELRQKVEADYWLRSDSFWSSGINWGAEASFEYEVENRLFSTYSDELEVSIWQGGEKKKELLSKTLEIKPFGKERLEWVVRSKELEPEGLLEGEMSQYSLVIRRGGVERKVIIYLNLPPYPPKIVPR